MKLTANRFFGGRTVDLHCVSEIHLEEIQSQFIPDVLSAHRLLWK